MSDSAMTLPCRLIGVREGMGPELLPTVLISPSRPWSNSVQPRIMARVSQLPNELLATS